MSTLKVNDVRHLSNSGTANLALESNGTTNLQATSTLGLTTNGTLTVSNVATFNGNVQIGSDSSDTMVLTSKVSGFNNFSGFTGEIRMYAGNAAGDDPPAGWLYCNGDTISSTINDGGANLGGTHYNADGKLNDYQPLFNLLKASDDWGNTNSASWGTDKVFVPDFRSRSPVGIATGAANAADARVIGSVTTNTGIALPTGLTARTLGDGSSIADGSTLVGKETHPLIEAELASHTHVITNSASTTGQSVSISNPTHTHTVPSGTSGSTTPSATGSTTPGAGGTQSASHTHSLQSSVSSWSGGSSYAATGTHIGNPQTTPNSGTQSASHTHTGAAHTHTSAAHTHTTPGSTTNPTAPGLSVSLGVETHTHASSAATTGSGTPHTILSPIIAVNYIIKV
jgi:microcystin-dependent protein